MNWPKPVSQAMPIKAGGVKNIQGDINQQGSGEERALGKGAFLRKEGKMLMEHWEHFSHSADIGVRGFGSTQESAFEQAALGAIAVMVDLHTVREQEMIELECEAPDEELLLVDWLNAVIFEVATRKMLFKRFKTHIDGMHLRGQLWGEKIDLDRHQPCVEIKGATCTEARVFQEEDKAWVAQCVVDV